MLRATAPSPRASDCRTLPVWGIILSLLFSACILIRYSYPFMVCVPMLALLILFSNRRPA